MSLLNFLVPEFRMLAEQLLVQCRQKGVEMRPVETLRSPYLQAKYWRQSRSAGEVNEVIKRLEKEDAPFLAHCIESIGACQGPRVTNALPGYSWHQWGAAMDCCWIVEQKAVWDLTLTINGINGYKLYADEARTLGLDAGYFWPSFQDAPHVQLYAQGSPSEIYSLSEINRHMQQCFGRSRPGGRRDAPEQTHGCK